jgi:hypothetical protein
MGQKHTVEVEIALDDLLVAAIKIKGDRTEWIRLATIRKITIERTERTDPGH